MHLRAYRVTGKAKKSLLTGNPDIIIHEDSMESSQSPMIPLANLELHDYQQDDDFWGEIPEVNFQDQQVIEFGLELGGGDDLEWIPDGHEEHFEADEEDVGLSPEDGYDDEFDDNNFGDEDERGDYF